MNPMPSIPTSPFLRRVLLADAATSAAAGLLMAFGAGPVAGLLGIPAGMLRPAGLALLPFAGFVLWLATREALPRAAVWAVVLCNALWAVECLLLLATGWISPTPLGVAFVLVQAATVALFAELQYLGLRRSPARLA
jgi:hypothetical protein